MEITLSDSENENEEEAANKAFTRKYETSSNASEEDSLYEDLAEAHKHLTTKWEKYCLLVEQQEKIIKELIQQKE
ncbi:hypothetical protein L195_g047271, partial [Trifolium pratense]